eukprot:TRINITY_DN21213_c1_g1_i2.p2 TRINITY_DN21213_c1_g1~~TRINITY_DN21213_c1_g1_i2.p2  ORF type:complete len:536 (+),score=122.30 TRINITY_DN21213_c1_g1_i2:88-1608(+)
MRATGGASQGKPRAAPEERTLREQLAAALELQKIGWQKYWMEVTHNMHLTAQLTRAGHAIERHERDLTASQKEARELHAANMLLKQRLAEACAIADQLRADLAQAGARASGAELQHREALSAARAAGEKQLLLLRVVGAAEPLVRAEQSARDVVSDCAFLELHRLAVEARSTVPRRRRAAPPTEAAGPATAQPSTVPPRVVPPPRRPPLAAMLKRGRWPSSWGGQETTLQSTEDISKAHAAGNMGPTQPGFATVRCVGEGQFGSAWLVRRQQGNRTFVMKEIKTRKEGTWAELSRKATEAQAAREYEMTRRAQGHLNVVRVYEGFLQTADERVRIVLEYCPKGCLSAHLNVVRGMDDGGKRAAELVTQVASGLDHVHSHCIAHRDVKAANVLIRDCGTAVVSDFGCAAAVSAQTYTAKGDTDGDPAIRAPEICPPNTLPFTFGTASDVWSLGLLIIEVYSGQIPRGRRVKVSKEVPCRDTIELCLSEDPNARPWARHVREAFSALV